MDVLNMIERIESILKERNITKGEFYNGSKLTDGAFSQWRTGKSNPSQRSISKISKYLNVSTQYLMYGLEEKEKLTTVSDDELSDDDKLLLSMYHSVPKEDRAEVFARILTELKNHGQL